MAYGTPNLSQAWKTRLLRRYVALTASGKGASLVRSLALQSNDEHETGKPIMRTGREKPKTYDVVVARAYHDGIVDGRTRTRMAGDVIMKMSATMFRNIPGVRPNTWTRCVLH